ncbi:MATE family efflux transporter [soil metagenome]
MNVHIDEINFDVDVGAKQEANAEKLAVKADENITKGSLWVAIWTLSWPLFLNMVTIAFASFADIWVAGKLGSEAQAAVGVSGQISIFMILLAVALSSGTNALVSRFWGEGDKEKTIVAARQALLFSVIFGFCSAGIGLLVCRPLLQLLGASPEVEKLGWDYLKFDLIAQLPFTVLWVSNSIFRARGDTRVPMIVMVLITAQVIALDYLLCIKPFNLGVAGIGMSWGIASILGLTLSLVLLKRSDLGECLNLQKMLSEASVEWFKRLMKIGIPACVQDLAWVGGNGVLLVIFAHTVHPTATEAAWGIGWRLEEMLGGFPVYALSMAVATIVGQNLGAKQPERAARAGWQVALVGGGLNAIIAAVLFFGARQLASAMTSDPLVLEYAVEYLQVVGLAQPFVAVWLILMGAMNGAGYTQWPMWASVVCLAVIRLPLAWLLTITFGMGPIGCWYAVAIPAVLLGLLMLWQFKQGTWKHQQV